MHVFGTVFGIEWNLSAEVAEEFALRKIQREAIPGVARNVWLIQKLEESVYGRSWCNVRQVIIAKT